jgi:GH25 family lysozyme M1 (1,4-beta-N-acetylmuramidase)
MTTPSVNDNPPIPPGHALMPQSLVTPDMTAWAVSILRNTAAYPMFAKTSKTFGATAVLARVEWHPPDFQNAAVHRGVTLYTPLAVAVARAEGIDVSGYQPRVDWKAVKAAGKAFAFIKATEGTTLVDHTFASHWKGARDAGVLRGAYHFLRPEHDAVAQAQFFLAQITDDPGELPPTVDVEVSDRVSVAHVAGCAAAFVDYVAATLGRPLVYTSPGFWNLLPDIPDIAAKADLWVANWGASPARVKGWSKWTFWQYTDKGTVSGIPGSADVDGDRFNGSVADLQAYCASVVGVAVPQAPAFDLRTTVGVQQALNYLHAVTPPLKEDGIAGPKTVAAIKAYQQSAGLAVDGIVGPDTMASLTEAVQKAAAGGG